MVRVPLRGAAVQRNILLIACGTRDVSLLEANVTNMLLVFLFVILELSTKTIEKLDNIIPKCIVSNILATLNKHSEY